MTAFTSFYSVFFSKKSEIMSFAGRNVVVTGENKVKVKKMGYKTEYHVHKSVGEGKVLSIGRVTG